MAYENLQLSRDGHVAVVTLDRPDKLNALSEGLSRDLLAVMDEVRANDAVRCVVVTGAGRGFCSGADLSDPALRRDPSEQSQGERLDEMGWIGRQAMTVSCRQADDRRRERCRRRRGHEPGTGVRPARRWCRDAVPHRLRRARP